MTPKQLSPIMSAVKRILRAPAASGPGQLTVARLPQLLIYRPLAVALALLLILPPASWLTSPGSGGFAQAQAQVSPLVISPNVLSAVALSAGGQQAFTATTLTGSTVNVTSWLLSSSSGQNAAVVGTIASTGPNTALYTAPSSISNFVIVQVTATSQDGSMGTSVIYLTPCTTGQILQNACATSYAQDLLQLESDSVNAYLVLHSLPATDAHIIYDSGRADLRAAIRATMLSTLLGIVTKSASARTPHEQNLYNWFQGLVQRNEIAEYQSAVDEYYRWQRDPCNFHLDSVIAKQYGLSYSGLPFCYQTVLSLFSGPPVPDQSYFLMYGLTRSYGGPALTYGNFGSLVASVAVDVNEVAGIGLGASAVLAATVGAAVYASAAAALAAFTAATISTAASAGAAASATFVVAGGTVSALGAGFIAAGPVAIVLIAAAIAVAAGMQAFSNQQTINNLNNLSNTLTQVKKTPPDLNAFATDSSGLGWLKLIETFTAQTLPDKPSTAPLPAPRTTDPQFIISGGAPTPRLTYQDWNGATWSAQLYGGWFVQTCTGSQCLQADSILASIRYVDWSGTKWTASRIGYNFVSTKAKPASSDTACPASTTTGVSPGPDFSKCLTYVSASIPLKDGGGNQITVSIPPPPPPPPPPQAPAFTSPSTVSFTTGRGGTATITASGYPAATISVTNGALPADITFTSGTGTATLTYSPASGAVGGTTTVTLTASNATGSAQQTVTINVFTTVTITSPPVISFTLGHGVGCSTFWQLGIWPLEICSGKGFLVTTTGYPTAKLSINAVPPGMTFTDNGNGTATIAGTATGYGDFLANQHCATDFFIGRCSTITASNGNSSATQYLGLLATASASATLVTKTANFTAGVANQVRVLSAGASTPVTYFYAGSTWQGILPSAPSWLSFRDNGNGTGVLSGTPSAGTSGSYNFVLSPDALGSNYDDSTANFTLNVNSAPVFLNPTISSPLTVGTSGTVNISLSAGTVSSNAALPQGLTFNAGNQASITGSPAQGTGGAYSLTLIGDAGATGTTLQSLVLNIQEPPKITSANSATFFTGQPGSFAVTTTGYPSVSTQPLPANPLPPTSPDQGKGMYFTVTGLPADLQFSNLNAENFATGTLTIQGTPSAGDAGVHQVTITAMNGVGVVATQTLTLNIASITGQAPTSGTTCNGTYTGTFTGNVTVSAGQNCSFVSGGITGNIAQTGGNLNLANATITGNVAVQGAAAFSIGSRTTIGKNLSIQNVASGAAMNQVCGTKVSGNVEVDYNATPVQLGSAQPGLCPGNDVGGNLNIGSNTAAIALYNSIITKLLSCASNSSITGGGNTAQQKQGQCVTF